MNKAIVFVDIQKDFINGALKNEKAIEVTPKIVEFAKECVEKCYKLYATRDTHEKTVYDNCAIPKAAFNPELPLTGYMTTLEGKNLPIEHCVEGTDGWMIDELLMDVIYGNCTFINKPTFGSFDLAEIIAEDFKNNLPEEIILCGFVTSICVLANAVILRAKFPNTKIIVLKDLCAGITEKDHDVAIEVLKMQQIDIR